MASLRLIFEGGLKLVFEGGLYLKAASIRENTVCSSFWNMKGEGIKVTSPEQKFLQEAHLTRLIYLLGVLLNCKPTSRESRASESS